MKVLTVTLNPAIDKTGSMQSLMVGRVNRMKVMDNIPGGKGINVAKVLKQLGEESVATGFLGGYMGVYIEHALKDMKMHCDFVRIEGNTRTNLNVLGEDGYVTEILEPGPFISEPELERFMEKYKGLVDTVDYVVLSGSVPLNIPVNIYGTLCEIASAAGKKVILDSSGDYLREGIKGKPYLVKPNKQELEYLVGAKLSNLEDVELAARKALSMGTEIAVVSLGSKGIMWVDKTQTIMQAPPAVKVHNTVGCGDSTVAALTYALLHNWNPGRAVHYAVAVAAANATTVESGQIPMETMEELLQELEG